LKPGRTRSRLSGKPNKTLEDIALGTIKDSNLLTLPNRIHHVTLNVTDPVRMTAFYKDILGMDVQEHSQNRTDLGFGGRTVLTLMHDKPYPRPKTRTQGLYHVAYLVPTREDLSLFTRHLAGIGYPLEGASDHGVSQALYLSDPEGNGIEIYIDRPQTEWPYRNGRLMMTTDPLDLEDLMALTDEGRPLPSGTILGHLHLHIGDLDRAEAFYGDLLSYKVTQNYGSQARFMSGGMYHHDLGLNVWLGRGIPVKNPEEQGLRGFKVLGTEMMKLTDIAGLELEVTTEDQNA
jgi:catechol 2,3-dioxygenase